MPLKRISANDLGRLLNSAKQPIYVLDDDLTVVFLNGACHEWLGRGRRRAFGPAMRLPFQPCGRGPRCRRCWTVPSPAGPLGRRLRRYGLPSCRRRHAHRRRARFLSLGMGEDDFFAVVAVVEAIDKPPDSAESPPPPNALPLQWGRDEQSPSEAIALHEQVRNFRREAAARYRADRLIGQGPAMRLARRQVELAAASRSSVLLVGPPGSGRRHLAAAIHYGADGAVGATLHCRPGVAVQLPPQQWGPPAALCPRLFPAGRGFA